MKKGIVKLLLLAGLLSTLEPIHAQDQYQEALQLYQQVITGQRKLEDLTPEQQQLILTIHRMLSTSDEKIEGYDFSLRDIERKCEVYKYSESYGDVECSGSDLRPVERKCEAYFSDPQNGELECRGSEFRIVERKCTVSMYSESYGEIDC